MPQDDFIADRIRWRASKHGLPAHETHAFSDIPDSLRASIVDLSRGFDTGSPILVFGNNPHRWTVLGTRGVISYYEHAAHYCPLSQIAAFDAAMPSAPKQEMEFVNVTLADSSVVRLWGPRGSQFFALWNILLGLSRFNLVEDCQPS